MRLDRNTLLAMAFLAGAATYMVSNLLPDEAATALTAMEAEAGVLDDDGALQQLTVSASGRSTRDFVDQFGTHNPDAPVRDSFGVLAGVVERLAAEHRAALEVEPGPAAEPELTPDPATAPRTEPDPKPVPEPVQPPPPLSLQLVMHSGGTLRAVVDSRIVRIGDVLAAGTVTRIQPASIQVEGEFGVLQYDLGVGDPRVLVPPVAEVPADAPGDSAPAHPIEEELHDVPDR